MAEKAELVEQAGVANEDGRHARRYRNKDAVIDAYVALVREGNPRPSIADVADRSAVSHRSVFRYFADKDELIRGAIKRQHAVARPLLALTVDPGAPLDERIKRFVERRLELFAVLAPVGRLSRAIAQMQPAVAAELTTSRQFFRAQAWHLFRAELEMMPADRAAAVLSAVDVLCSFESVELLRNDQGLSAARTARVLEHSLRALLHHRNVDIEHTDKEG